MEARRARACDIFFLCLMLLLLPNVQAVGEWTYLDDGTGPNNWTAISSPCGGTNQSPINIETATVVDSPLGSFTLVGFGADDVPEEASMEVSNNGHSVVVSMEGDYLVSGAGLGSTAYKVVQFHFHWGSVNTQGSEHTIDGTAKAAEMHMVAYNTKYDSFFTSLNYKDGLTVLGFLIGVQGEDNAGFTTLVDAFSQIQYYHDEFDLATPVIFANILPDNLSSFYRYNGSLTTPTCNEIVTWNVFQTPIMLSEAQLSTLRNQYTNALGDPENITLTDNFRPVQAVNGRTVYMNSGEANPSSTPSSTPSSASGLYATTSLVTMVIIKLLASVLTE